MEQRAFPRLVLDHTMFDMLVSYSLMNMYAERSSRLKDESAIDAHRRFDRSHRTLI